MKIKDLVTPEQYNKLKKDYAFLVKYNQITFFEFCTKTYKINYKNKLK